MTTALFLPYYEANPYQDELARGLEASGVSVVTGDHTAPLPVVQAFLEHGRPDVLHVHWAHSLVGSRWRVVTALLGIRFLLELLLARVVGVDIVWTVHNRFHHETEGGRAERWFRHAICRLSGAVVVHGETARDATVDAYGLPDHVARRIEVVPHGNYVDCYENEVSRAAAREELGLPADATVFCNVGNIRPYKNVPELVETFRSLPGADRRLVVAGQPPADPDERERLADRCAADDRVDCHFEYVPSEDLQYYLNAADVVVAPFTEVLTSGSVVLGLSFGRPVVAPRLGCIPETVGDCDDLLYYPDDPQGLERALRRALTADLDALEDRARARAEELDWERIGRRTAAVYDEVDRSLGSRATSVLPSLDRE